jgi:hypothetical protein
MSKLLFKFKYLCIILNRSIIYGGRIGAFGLIPILSMNRAIDNTFSVNSSTTIIGSDINDANFGFVKVLPKLGVRIDGDINIQDSELNSDLIASKDINKKFSIIFVKRNSEKTNLKRNFFAFFVGALCLQGVT